MDCPLATIRVLCVVIDSTWDDVIDADVVYCRGASDLKSGIPRAPCAGSGSVYPNSVGGSRSSITS